MAGGGGGNEYSHKLTTTSHRTAILVTGVVVDITLLQTFKLTN
jgi:hypothetical protein